MTDSDPPNDPSDTTTASDGGDAPEGRRPSTAPRPSAFTNEKGALDALQGSVGVYATAAGLLSALPVPYLDSMLASLARGAAMRRVAARHGVRLTPEAREILAKGDEDGASSGPMKFIRSVAGRFLAPLRLVNRAEEALSAFASATLLDHYLETAPRRPGAPMTAEEARRVRAAMKGASSAGVVDALRDTPTSVVIALRDIVNAARGSDAEGRALVERVMDAMLDAIADAPEGLGDSIHARFDDSLARALTDGEPKGGSAS